MDIHAALKTLAGFPEPNRMQSSEFGDSDSWSGLRRVDTVSGTIDGNPKLTGETTPTGRENRVIGFS